MAGEEEKTVPYDYDMPKATRVNSFIVRPIIKPINFHLQLDFITLWGKIHSTLTPWRILEHTIAVFWRKATQSSIMAYLVLLFALSFFRSFLMDKAKGYLLNKEPNSFST